MASDPVKHLQLWRAIVAYSPMTVQEKSVLQCLCSYGDSDGTKCWPSQRTLAQLNGMSIREMRRVFKDLKEHKFIIEDGWKHRCRLWRINAGLFLVDTPKKERVKKEKSAAAAPAKPVVPETPKPVVIAPVIEVPPPLTPEQIAKRHADKAKVLEKLGRR